MTTNSGVPETTSFPVFTWTAPSDFPVLPILFSPNIGIRLAYFSEYPLTMLKNRIELVLPTKEVEKLYDITKVTLSSCKMCNLNIPTIFLEFLEELIKNGKILYISVPYSLLYIQKSVENESNHITNSDTMTVVIKRKLSDYLVLGVCKNNKVLQGFTSIPQLYLSKTIPMIYINGERLSSMCDLCPNKIPGISTCMFYTTNYECFFTSGTKIDVNFEQERLSAVASLGSMLGDEIVNSLDDTITEIEDLLPTDEFNELCNDILKQEVIEDAMARRSTSTN